MKSNIRQIIELLKTASSIGDLDTAENLLRKEGIMLQNLELAKRMYHQNNKQAMTALIFGPVNFGSGRGLINDLEIIAKQKGL
jgi:hypothetical protein